MQEVEKAESGVPMITPSGAAPGSEPSPSRLAPCHLPRKGEVLLYLPEDVKKLPLRGSWHRVAMTERVQPTESLQKLSPQRRAFAESGAAPAACLYDPFL